MFFRLVAHARMARVDWRSVRVTSARVLTGYGAILTTFWKKATEMIASANDVRRIDDMLLRSVGYRLFSVPTNQLLKSVRHMPHSLVACTTTFLSWERREFDFHLLTCCPWTIVGHPLSVDIEDAQQVSHTSCGLLFVFLNFLHKKVPSDNEWGRFPRFLHRNIPQNPIFVLPRTLNFQQNHHFEWLLNDKR